MHFHFVLTLNALNHCKKDSQVEKKRLDMITAVLFCGYTEAVCLWYQLDLLLYSLLTVDSKDEADIIKSKNE